MTETEILRRIAELEFVHDQLLAELDYVDHLLKSVGFPEGIESAKRVAEELLEDPSYMEWDEYDQMGGV